MPFHLPTVLPGDQGCPRQECRARQKVAFLRYTDLHSQESPEIGASIRIGESDIYLAVREFQTDSIQ